MKSCKKPLALGDGEAVCQVRGCDIFYEGGIPDLVLTCNERYNKDDFVKGELLCNLTV